MIATDTTRGLRELLATLLAAAACAIGSPVATYSQSSDASTKQVHAVVLVTIDGVRFQEVFGGADRKLLDTLKGAERQAAETAFWRDSPDQRRRLLMPFLWSVVVQEGSIFGDPDAGSPNQVTNGKNFSYPGYSELLVGYSDDRVDSNNKVANPNPTVLEWLEGQEALRGKVAALGSWDVFPYILRAPEILEDGKTNGLFVNAGWQDLSLGSQGSKTVEAELQTLNWLTARTFREWDYLRNDSFTTLAARLTVRQTKPRVIYLALGEPDDWAHQGRYERYLRTTRDADGLIQEFWDERQEDPFYKGRTALVITTDHGRGEGAEWTGHGSSVKWSDRGWIAVVSPVHSALGVVRDKPSTLAQTAATVARLLGYDYPSDSETPNGAVAPSLPLEP